MQGRVALVTGGGRGIGREVALLLSAAGARVMVVSRHLYNLAGQPPLRLEIAAHVVDANRVDRDVEGAVDVPGIL